MSLSGKFFFHCGKEYCHTGEIIEQIDAATVLIKIDTCEHMPPSMNIVAVADMMTKIGPDGDFGYTKSAWEFFATREQLEAYEAWLDTPSEERHAAPVPAKALN